MKIFLFFPQVTKRHVKYECVREKRPVTMADFYEAIHDEE